MHLNSPTKNSIFGLLIKVSKVITHIPTPSSISYMWNFGSLLGVMLLIQLLSGIFLSMHYESSMEDSFSSVVSIWNDVNSGWLIRSIHANGASAFFICIYFHIGRGLYYGSYQFVMVWCIGVLIFLILMMTAFLGYVLPWGQMSFWGATVITNLISAVPYIGSDVVEWLWGGFSVGKPTLIRFFSIHFILPFVLLGLVVLHIAFLHNFGSSNPLGLDLNLDKIHFQPFFTYKDIMGLTVMVVLFSWVILYIPDLFMDPDNFIMANPMNTPPHIQPEWYFLFAYAILRSIPSKLGGVIALILSILILLFLPIFNSKIVNARFNPVLKLFFWFQVMNFFILMWLGMKPAEEPFTLLGQLISFFYFFIFLFWGFF